MALARSLVRTVGVWLGGAVTVLALAAGNLRAQSTEAVLAERRLEYRAVLAEHEAAQSAFRVVEQRFATALSDVTRARRGQDKDALERALAAALDRSLPVRDQSDRVREVAIRLQEARKRLTDVMTIRLSELVEALSVAGPEERRQLDAVWTDLNLELRALEAEQEDPTRLDPVVLQDQVGFDPRDGPDDREAKAQILERTAAIADSVAQDLDRQIQGLQDRLRQERQREAFVARVDRFGDAPPVVPTRRPEEPPTQVPDSAGGIVRPPTLEERISRLESAKLEIEAYRDRLLVRAEQFRRFSRSRA